MSTEERKVPELRFKGFNDDWEQRQLNDVVKFSKGKFYSKNDLVEDGNEVILYGQLYTNYQTAISYSDTKVIPKPNSVYSMGKEVIIPSSGESAEDISIASSIIASGIIIAGDLNILTPLNTLNNTFLALALSNGKSKKELSKYAQGKSIVHLHGKDFKKLILKYPNLNEQIKIKEFVLRLDNLINLHQRKHKALQEIIKAYKQQIFNQKLIFKCVDGFYERNWKNYKFSNFMSKYTTLERAEDIKKNQLLSVKLFGKGVEVANQNRALKLGSTVYYKRSYGDFIYGKQNFFNGAFGFVPKSLDGYYSSGDVPSLKFDSGKVDRDFFIHFINRESFYKRAEIYASGTGSKRIHENTLLDFEVCFPSINSQIEIGKFFRNLDEIVYQNLIILEKLESTKKEYLNKMFI